jgi:uncharacterized membrane protein YccF (DUF307 family)
MSFIGNIIWLVLGGIIGAVIWFIAGLLLCITIIGIPFGLQCFKIAGFVLWPFGRDVEIGDFGACGLLLNVLWILFLGWELAAYHLAFGALLCITIIGIPFGIQHFKLAMLGLVPFGARIYGLGIL